MQPLLTIIAISYNQEKYILETLNSIKAQTYPNIQLIISDDGSKDGTKELIDNWVKENYPSAIFLNNKTNVGITRNLNRAIPYIKGSFVKQIGCDDVLEPDSVNIIMQQFANLPSDYGVVYTDMYRINENSELIDDMGLIEKRGHPPHSGFVYKEMIQKPFITSASIIFKKEVLDKLVKFNEDVFYEDNDTYLRASKYFKFQYIPEKTVRYRVHAESQINSQSQVKYFHNTFYVYYTSYDSNQPYKDLFLERLFFCIKNMTSLKYRKTYKFALMSFMRTGNYGFIKYMIKGLPLAFTGNKL